MSLPQHAPSGCGGRVEADCPLIAPFRSHSNADSTITIPPIIRIVSSRSIISNATAIVLDQALLSAVGFAVGAAFIYGTTPEAYGQFVLLQSIFLLLASVQNAAVNTPMMVLAARMPPSSAQRFDRGLLAGLVTCGLPASVVAVLVAQVATGQRFTAATYLLVALCFVPLLVRDYLRAREFSRSRGVDALRRDTLYALIALISLAGLALTGSISVVRAYMVLAVAAGLSAATSVGQYLAARPTLDEVSSAYRQSWPHSRWSLVGATASWIQGNAYVYIPFFLLGASAVAVPAAARLAITPIALLTQSWSNHQRPLLSRLLAQGQTAEAKRTCYWGAIALGVVLTAYVGALLLMLRFTPAGWLPPDYRDMRPAVLLWSGVMLFQIIRSSLSWLLQASLEFEVLAKLGLCTAIGTIGMTAPAVVAIGAFGGLVGMLASEVALTGALLRAAHRRCSA